MYGANIRCLDQRRWSKNPSSKAFGLNRNVAIHLGAAFKKRYLAIAIEDHERPISPLFLDKNWSKRDAFEAGIAVVFVEIQRSIE
ncbi:hypothetical protein TRP8649_03306 [Pelagimonas phthalicica]|uniref:Uncharacterized protein n=1 Tax=Pelagimonas phthalicica TaxID=1037362 RepID=A0A238JFL5_9RHOB|nr:hypothetical protein CLV87_3306 [Pelagimonas phthalicica]SMX29173.1 hypothetical protein TRP8649_03306 [Pelagimonas phthalicica]